MAKIWGLILTSNFLLLSTLQAATTAVSPVTKSSAKEAQALTVASAWLASVDKKDYKLSWELSAELFKSNVTANEWQKAVTAMREPLGSLVSRKLKQKTYSTNLPGVPDGEYVSFQFDSQFQNRKAALETISTLLDKDMKWHVSGYFIK